MTTNSFDYLKRELATILQDYTGAQDFLPGKAAVNLKRYASLSKGEIARQLRISVAAAESLSW